MGETLTEIKRDAWARELMARLSAWREILERHGTRFYSGRQAAEQIGIIEAELASLGFDVPGYGEEVEYPGEVIYAPSAEQNPRRLRPCPKMCDYCCEVPPDGYVQAYDSWVCEECYEDHHGR